VNQDLIDEVLSSKEKFIELIYKKQPKQSEMDF